MEADLFRSLMDHLRYYGYEMHSEDGILKPVEIASDRLYFWVLPINRGATFRAVFRFGPAVREDPTGFSRFLNEANQTAVVSRFVASEEYIAVEAWFPPAYSKDAFALFFNRYLADI